MYLCQSSFLSPSQKIAADPRPEKASQMRENLSAGHMVSESPFVSNIISQSMSAVNYFFHFFLLLNLGKITVISLAHTRDLPGFTTKLCGFPLIYRYLLGCNFHSRHSEPVTSDKNPMKNFVI